MTKRRRLLWLGFALVLLAVVVRFVLRWADATGRLRTSGDLVLAGATVLLLVALVGGLIVLMRRSGQTRRNR